MNRRWNWGLWLGFGFAVAGLVSYPFFIQFPITRDIPWVNFLLFATGGILLAVALRRAFTKPEGYRGKVFGPILTLLGLSILAFFSFGIFYLARQLPESKGAPRVGMKAPDFTLPDQKDKPVSLGDLISSKSRAGKPGAALLIFYRGFW